MRQGLLDVVASTMTIWSEHGAAIMIEKNDANITLWRMSSIGSLFIFEQRTTSVELANKIINSIRAIKSAVLMVYIDSGMSWDWLEKSEAHQMIDAFLDRPMLTGSSRDYSWGGAYTVNFKGENSKMLAAVVVSEQLMKSAVRYKIANYAERCGIYEADGITPYKGESDTLYFYLD